MGLLDHRDAPGYNPKLEKYQPLYNFTSKILSMRKSKTLKSAPVPTTRLYAYHLLTQQGVPGGLKVVFVFGVMTIPIVLIQTLSSRYHPYRKDPFRT